MVDAQLEASAEVVDCDVGLLGFGRTQVAHISNVANYVYIMDERILQFVKRQRQ